MIRIHNIYPCINTLTRMDYRGWERVLVPLHPPLVRPFLSGIFQSLTKIFTIKSTKIIKNSPEMVIYLLIKKKFK